MAKASVDVDLPPGSQLCDFHRLNLVSSGCTCLPFGARCWVWDGGPASENGSRQALFPSSKAALRLGGLSLGRLPAAGRAWLGGSLPLSRS